jgi:Legume lectin domain
MKSICGGKAQRSFLFLVMAISCAAAQIASAAFTYPNFSSTAGLNLVGTTSQFGSRLRLTSAQVHQVGGVWTTSKQSVANGFSTSFAFEVSDPDPNFGADGFAFLVQNDSVSALGTGGSALGFMDIGEGPGIANFLGVEFDTLNSGITFDTNDNHIAVQSKSPGQDRVFLGTANPPFTIQSGGVHTAQVTYTPGTLKIAVDGSATPLLQVSVNLNSLLGLADGNAWVGFTAATGAAWENHDIVNWSFSSVPEPSALCLLLIGLPLIHVRRWTRPDFKSRNLMLSSHGTRYGMVR